MYQRVKLKDSPEVKRVVLAAFPGYRKRQAVLCLFGSYGRSINSYWNGGSRNEYAIVELTTGQVKPLPTQSHPYFDIAGRGIADQENEVVSVDHFGNIMLKHLPEGYALVQAGTFDGEPSIATVYLNPANLTPLLETGGQQHEVIQTGR